MRTNSKAIILILMLLLPMGISGKRVELHNSSNNNNNNYYYNEFKSILETDPQSKKYIGPGIWYLPDLSKIDPKRVVYKFKMIEGGLVDIDQSENYKINNGIELTDSYFQIKRRDQEFDPRSINLNQNIELLEVEKAWEWGYTGENSVIAVIDTGIDFLHPSLVGKKINEKTFVKEEFGYPSDESVEDLFGHGTSVAGLIAGNDPNYQEYRGAAFDAKLVNAKVANSEGVIYSSGLLAAMDWAANLEEVDIINLSLGEIEESPATDLLEKMANAAVQLGKLVVSSSGNSGRNGKNTFEPFTIGSPGSAVEAISISAIDFSKNLASQSSEGPTMGWEVKPDFVAPGVNIVAAKIYSNYNNCISNACYESISGTSFAAPIFSGALAVVYSALLDNELPNNPGIIKGVAHMSSTSLGLPWYQEGSGLVNVTRMLSTLINGSYSGIILPKGNHHPQITTIPAGETARIPITIIGNSLSSWTNYDDNGNASAFTSIEIDENKIGYSQIITLTVNPSNTTIPGSYVYDYNITNQQGLSVPSSLTITITEPAKYRLLLDLTHTPWDATITSSSKQRLERILGKDTQDLIDILIENSVWVDELLTGSLTNTILEKYDVIWMPSVFVDPIPSFIDRKPLRSQNITNEELMALYQFKQNGGKFIIDFGGSTVNDFYNGITVPDLFSLESLMSLFGIRVSNVSNDKGIKSGFVNSELNFAVFNYQTTIGKITLSNGIPIVTDGEFNQIAGFIGENKEMAIMINNRNWRDETRLKDNQVNGPRYFAKAVVNWLLKGDRISSLSVNKINDKIELSILFNETIKSNILTLQINSSQGLQDLNDIAIKGDSLIATLDGAVDGLYSIIIRYGSETTVFQKEIDSQGPSIKVNIKEGLADSNGKIWTIWDLILLDNEIIPRYNSLVTIDKNSDEIKLDQTETGYRITASNSYVEFTEVLVIIEVVDSLGQYNQFELNLTEFLLNNNDSKDQNKSIIENDTALIVGLLVLITLLILAYATLGKNKTKAN